MTQLVVSSLITASMYAIMAIGLVVVFKTVRVFNFAHGQVAALGGYVACSASTEWHLPFLAVLVVGTAVGALTCLVLERVVLARLYQRSVLEMVVATFGASLILRAFIAQEWGDVTRTFTAPFQGQNLNVLGATISVYGIVLVGVAAAVVAGMSMVLAKTDLGLRLRATFDDPVAARMQGIRVARVRTLAWVVGGALAGVAGALLTPILFLTPGVMDQLLIVALAAAVIGGFSSLYGAVIGGFAVAFAGNLMAAYVSLRFKDVLLYGLVIVFLWARPYGLFGTAEEDEASSEGERVGWVGRHLRQVTDAFARSTLAFQSRVLRGWPPSGLLVAFILVMMFLAPSVVGQTWQLNLMGWLTSTIAVSGMALVMFYSRRLTLAQGAYMAIGAYAMAKLLENHPGAWPIVLVGVTLGVGVIGGLFEIPCLRLEGAYYAVATLAVGLIVPLVALKWTSFTDGSNGMSVPYITSGGTPLNQVALYNLTAAIAAGVLVVLLVLRNSPFGRTIVAVRDSRQGGASLGVAEAPRRVLLGAAAAALGGLAGALGTLQTNLVTPTSFGLDIALALFVAAVLAGSIVGAAWGAAVITLIPVLLKDTPDLAGAAYGVIVLVVVFALPQTGEAAVDALRRIRPSRRQASLGSVWQDSRERAVLAESGRPPAA